MKEKAAKIKYSNGAVLRHLSFGMNKITSNLNGRHLETLKAILFTNEFDRDFALKNLFYKMSLRGFGTAKYNFFLFFYLNLFIIGIF